MGLFALTTSGLSTYIWLVTIWDLYRPLSSTIASKAPSLNVTSLINTLTSQNNDVHTASRSRRSKVRLENAQREQVRSSLKALFIWLMMKGTESIFDNSLGYILPFYNLSKALVLLVFVCFRVQICKQFFDSFILPLGKPNAPLLDIGPLGTVVFPSMRFLLSLPFSHLFVALKNYAAPYLETPQPVREDEISTSDESSIDSLAYTRRLPSDQALPPSSRSTSGSSNKGGGTNGAAGGGAGSRLGDRILTMNRKVSPIPPQTSIRSNTLGRANVANDAYAVLQGLPPAPQRIPNVSNPPSNIGAGPSSQRNSSIQPFAFIPPTTPPPKVDSDRVRTNDAFVPIVAATPKMPGFLTSKEMVTASVQQESSNAEKDVEINTDVIKEGASRKRSEVNGVAGKSRRTATTRKRGSDDESEASPCKTRAPPSRGKIRAISQSSTMTDIRPKADARMKKSVSSTTKSLSEAASLPQEASLKPRARTRRKEV